jgi:hypothetical protein
LSRTSLDQKEHMSSNRRSHHDSGLLAAADVGTISCSADGVITMADGYVSLRLEGPAFREFHAFLTSAKQRPDLEPAAVASHGGAALPGLH